MSGRRQGEGIVLDTRKQAKAGGPSKEEEEVKKSDGELTVVKRMKRRGMLTSLVE